MTTTRPATFDEIWTIKKIAPQLEKLNEIPLFGGVSSFDWSELASLISSRFNVKSLSLQPGAQEWLLPGELRKGFGHDAVVFPIDLTPLGSTVYWMMPKQEIKKLTSWMLSGSTEKPAIASDLLQEGFYQYILLETLDAAFSIDLLKTLTPILHEEAPLPEEKAFCIDITIQFQGKSCHGRLIIPNELRLHWGQHFERLNMRSVSPQLARDIEVVLGIKTGSVLLNQSQWETLKKGDFILLDRGSYDPLHSKGLATLTLGTTALFQLKIEKNKIHLLNFAFTYEDATDMTTNNPPEDDMLEDDIPEDDVEDTDLSEETQETLTPEEEAESVGIKETPMFITVELARLRMTLEKLMQLAPGNFLELPIQSDQGMVLTVNGQKIGKAELVYLGENLGVRITELG
ncbi:MAG TPA: YscQ/HrcQ family type III secretion apparatus protein [Parachlamydiales bacterium]|nr:YscQ/HrcQ family type III secretion apparatus protein [Parachlamydiales bacterium]